MSMTPYKTIGNHLHIARKQLHLTQAQVAERANLSLNHYSDIERGEAKPSIDSLILICDAMHLPVPEVFKGVVVPMKEGENHLLTDEEFLAFFATMNETVSIQKKTVMIGVCRLIASMDDRPDESQKSPASIGESDCPSAKDGEETK